MTRRWLAPEVVQTSGMDCGPATLKCLLEGFGVPVSYGRLREACQTDVDGTSIDTMEEIGGQLGLDAEQILLPPDHLFLMESAALPAIVVVRLPNGLTHFVVVWRRVGSFVQVMDPSIGRRWLTRRRFLEEVYVHTMNLPAADWREWAGSEEFLGAFRRRLAVLNADPEATKRMIEVGLADASWRTLAALDAAARMVDAVVRAGGLRPGPQAARVLQNFFDKARSQIATENPPIPIACWSARPAPAGAAGVEQLAVSGVVLVRVRGRKPEDSPAGNLECSLLKPPLSPELIAALEEAPSRPGRELFTRLRADGWLTPATLLGALAVAAAGLVMEALLFRALFDVGRELSLTSQRLTAMGGLCLFTLSLLLLELPILTGLLRMGRRLEMRLRIAFLEKLPRLADRYFQSRLTSDMAERSHMAHWIRQLPMLAGSLARYGFELVLTTAGIIWLDPGSAPVALLAAALAAGLPLMFNPVLSERDLRVRTHTGALSRFYLDALLGLVPIRAHGAERAVRSEHESLLVEWARAGLGLQRAVVGLEGICSLTGLVLAVWLLFAHLQGGGEAGAVLLLIYWALNLPVLGQEIALLARQYPLQRNVTLRLLEPLGAPEEKEDLNAEQEADTRPQVTDVAALRSTDARSIAVSIRLEDVTVRAGGHTILQDLNLEIASGSHVGIVGPSGAGKSSLVGLLLGWHRAASGRVLVDGRPLDARRLEELRRHTAWVDPAVQLWNRSLIDNLRYGAPDDAALSFGWAIEQADLLKVLEKLPDGLQSPLGEGGALVSGGEAQRVRFARGILRPEARLAILDEPFRGLDRNKRRQLLARARKLWSQSTLLCITHDVGETQTLDRVLVIENGRLVEDGSPPELASRAGSRYAALLEAEDAVRRGLWSSDVWRRLRLENGKLQELDREERFSPV